MCRTFWVKTNATNDLAGKDRKISELCAEQCYWSFLYALDIFWGDLIAGFKTVCTMHIDNNICLESFALVFADRPITTLSK